MKGKMKLKFDPYKFNKTVSNDIPVHWKNIPWANGFVYVYIIINIGARHDPLGKEGLAHFLEHLPFNGCCKWPTFDDIEGVNQSLLSNTLNANTSFEKTVFTCRVDKMKLAEVMKFLRYFIFAPVIDPVEVERERKVITQEIWRMYGNIRREILEKRDQKLMYGNHAFGRMERAFGWHDTVSKITRNDISKFHSAHYCSGNTSILLVGDVDESELGSVDLLTEFIPVGEQSAHPKKVLHWPNPAVNKFTTSISKYFNLSGSSVPKKASVNVFRAMPIPKNGQVLFIARDLVYQVLFTQIRGKLGAMYSPKVSGDIFSDHCYVNISLEISPDVMDKVQVIVSRIIEEIAYGSKKHASTFENAKSVYLEKKLFNDPSIKDIISDAANELSVTGEIKPTEEDYSDAEKVSYSDIVRMFSHEFGPDQLFWSIQTP